MSGQVCEYGGGAREDIRPIIPMRPALIPAMPAGEEEGSWREEGEAGKGRGGIAVVRLVWLYHMTVYHFVPYR